MRVVLLAIGSRGDIQPYLALGLGLKAEGHEVCLATERNYKNWIMQEGLEYAYLPGDSKARHAQEPWLKLLEETKNRPILSAYRGYSQFILPTLRELLDAAWEACQGADAIISTAITYGGHHIAEKLGIQYYSTWTCPSTPTREFPHSWSRQPNRPWLGGALNRFSYWVAETIESQVLLDTINLWRKETLGLPPSGMYGNLARSVPRLYNFSPLALERPADWPENVHCVGYWLLNRDQAVNPSDALLRFLADGDPPIYIGFGSIGDRQANKTLQTAIDAVVASGQRAIVEGGWAKSGKLNIPPQVFKLDAGAVPHAWLFPRMAALVHHGGAGTTGQGLRDGKPMVILYQKYTDYYFWGQRAAALGVGPAPIYIDDLTVEPLAQAIQTMVTDIEMQTRAAELGRKMQTEDGVARCIELIYQYLPKELRARPSEKVSVK